MRQNIDIEYFRNLLEERLSVIKSTQEIGKAGDAAVELDQARVGRLSRVEAMQQQAIAQACARLTSLERQRIEAALARIRNNEYGSCVECGEEIAEGRLRFDPSVLLCIDCAQQKENEPHPAHRRRSDVRGQP